MNGRQQIAEHQSRVDAAFARAKALENADADQELRSDMAKYLCVLVSGLLERSISEMLVHHARRCGAPTLQKYVEQTTRYFTNANSEKLKTILGSFNSDWRDAIEVILVDETKDAIDSLLSNRHLIAHGRSVGVTYTRNQFFYVNVKRVIELVILLCDPD